MESLLEPALPLLNQEIPYTPRIIPVLTMLIKD